MFSEDFARFIMEYYNSGVTESINVGDPENRSVLEMAEIALKVSNSNAITAIIKLYHGKKLVEYGKSGIGYW